MKVVLTDAGSPGANDTQEWCVSAFGAPRELMFPLYPVLPVYSNVTIHMGE